jgi:hypothetical protein
MDSSRDKAGWLAGGWLMAFPVYLASPSLVYPVRPFLPCLALPVSPSTHASESYTDDGRLKRARPPPKKQAVRLPNLNLKLNLI